MKQEEVFVVEDSDITFENSLKSVPTLDSKKINVLILPSNTEKGAFYSGTLDTLDYLTNSLEKGSVDILTTDDDYREIGLHSDDFWLGSFLVSSVFVPVFVNFISSYIYDILKVKNDDHIEMSVNVEGTNGKSKKVKFRGNVKNMKKAIDAINDLSND